MSQNINHNLEINYTFCCCQLTECSSSQTYPYTLDDWLPVAVTAALCVWIRQAMPPIH